MSLTPDDIDAAILADAQRYFALVRPILAELRSRPPSPEEKSIIRELVDALRELDVDLRLFGADSEAEAIRALLGEGPAGSV